MLEAMVSLLQSAGKPGVVIIGFVLVIVFLSIFVQGMKRLGCVDVVACPSLFGLAGAGGLLVIVRLMV